MICKKSGHKSLSGFQDVSFEGYKKHLVSAAAPGPLSREELEREEVKQAQIHAAVAVDTKKQLVTGKGVYLPTKSGHKIQRIWSQNSPNLVTKFTKSGHTSLSSSEHLFLDVKPGWRFCPVAKLLFSTLLEESDQI